MSVETTIRNDPASPARLWIFTELYYPEETSTGFLMTKIAEGLADEFDVRVVCGQPNYSARGVTAAAHERHRSVEIRRVWSTRFNKNSLFRRLVNALTLSLSTLWTAVRRLEKGDRVLAVTTPPTLPFVAGLAALVRGAGLTLLIHDSYPEFLIATGKTSKGSVISRVLDLLNNWLFKHTSRIIVIGRDMKDLIQRKTNGLSVPVSVIPNWSELDSIRPVPRQENALLTTLAIYDKFVFLCAGNMGYSSDIESVLYCAIHLRGHDHIHFVFLGEGRKRNWLISTVKAEGLTNVTVLDPRPRKDQESFLNACDVAVVSLVPGMLGVSVPSRTYNIMAAGKPILAVTDPASELGLIVAEEKIGWVVPPGEREALLETMKQLVANSNDLENMGERSRKAAESKYSLENAIARYKGTLS